MQRLAGAPSSPLKNKDLPKLSSPQPVQALLLQGHSGTVGACSTSLRPRRSWKCWVWGTRKKGREEFKIPEMAFGPGLALPHGASTCSLHPLWLQS